MRGRWRTCPSEILVLLRNLLPQDASDQAVLQLAYGGGHVLLTCNRDDDWRRVSLITESLWSYGVERERRRGLLCFGSRGVPGLGNNINFA